MFKKSLSRPNLDKYLIIFVVIYAFVYTLSRAALIPVFHDEARTYFFSQHSWLDIFQYKGMTANNHLLNTLMIKICAALFGMQEIVLRIPALIGHGLYLFGLYRVSQRLFGQDFLLPATVFMIFNPFLLELFSAARGYGLALGFFMLGLSYAFASLEQEDGSAKRRSGFLALMMFAVASSAHLAFLYVFVALFLCLTGREVYMSFLDSRNEGRLSLLPRRALRNMRGYFIITFVLLAAYLIPVMRMMGHKEMNFWYGGTRGFWSDTAGSLIKDSFYGQQYLTLPLLIFVKNIVLAFWAAGMGMTLYRICSKKKFFREEKFLAALLAFLGAVILIILINFQVFGIRYASGRTAVYFLPLAGLMIALVLKIMSLWQSRCWPFLAKGSMTVLALTMLLHFYFSANTWYYYVCPYDASTRAAMAYIKDLNQGKAIPDNSLSLGIHWIYQQSVNFYRKKEGLSWLKETKIRDLDLRHDYYLLTTNARTLKEFVLDDDVLLLRKFHLKKIKEFPATGAFLAVQ